MFIKFQMRVCGLLYRLQRHRNDKKVRIFKTNLRKFALKKIYYAKIRGFIFLKSKQ